MGNPLKAIGEWLVQAMTSELKKPLEETRREVAELNRAQKALAALVESKHASDGAALECDLSLLHERIYYMIGRCREKGYTTAEDRLIIDRMHFAYQGRGGNHGEGGEYEIYKRLPTEEEWRRMHESDQS